MKVFIVCVFVSFFIQSTAGLRILGIFPLQVKSHFVTCEELMKGLAAKGHQVDVYSHFPQKKPIPNFKDISLKGLLPSLSNNMSLEMTTTTSVWTLFKNWCGVGDSVCGLMGHPIFQKLIHEPPKDPPYDLIVTEVGVSGCYVALGRHMNLPVVAVVTMELIDYMNVPFGTPLSLATDPSLVSQYSSPMSFFERLDNLLVYYSTVMSYSLHTRGQHRTVEKYLGPGYPSIVNLFKDVSLVLLNHDQALSGVRTFAPMVVPVGSLHVIDRNETMAKDVQEWLDNSHSGCIYFTFGSMARIELFPRHILNAFYATFRDIAPVRILMKIAEPKLLPPGLPDNVMTRPWFEQIPVLKHKNMKAFITHGGLMGTQESIYFGVPLVGIPLTGDQFYNVARYVKKKIAVKVHLNEITEKKFTDTLNEILWNPVYRKNTEEISRKVKDRPMSAIDIAIYWVEYIHRHGKDALRSPIVDMPWWQVALSDVYAFIVALSVLALYIVKKIVTILIHLMSSSKSNLKKKDN